MRGGNTCEPRLALLFLLFAAPAAALPPEEAKHLLARTGFGVAGPEDVRALGDLSREEAVRRLLSSMRAEATLPPPALLDERLPSRSAGGTKRERLALRKGQARALKAWWVEEMIATPSPFTERMVLLFHGHFTSSLRKVRQPALLYEQNALFRREARGSFARLLRAIAEDPAMLVYLDGGKNRPSAPNENFARELFELFTLGEGRGYDEDDVREAARAFAGTRTRRRTGEVRQAERDEGEKTVLGVRGDLDGRDVVEIVLRHPRTAEHVVEKLWRELVSPAPEPAEVARLAALFRDGGYELEPLLFALLTSEAFWREEHRGVLVKSPVDLVIGAARVFGEEEPIEPGLLADTLAVLGQDLFDPPSVQGWLGHTRWITAATLPVRERAALALARRVKRRFSDEDLALLLPLPAAPRDLVDVVLDPAFQLK